MENAHAKTLSRNLCMGFYHVQPYERHVFIAAAVGKPYFRVLRADKTIVRRAVSIVHRFAQIKTGCGTCFRHLTTDLLPADPRALIRCMRCSVKIHIIPDQEHKYRPYRPAIVCTARSVLIQNTHNFLRIKEFLCAFRRK